MTPQANNLIRTLFGLALGLLGLGLHSVALAGDLGTRSNENSASSKENTEKAKLAPDQRLDAIRRALVKASLQGATQVQTMSWIDENGALRDSASFRSNMRVRGVQVLAYGQNEEGEPEAQLGFPAEATAREDLVKAKSSIKDACPKPIQGLRQVVGVDVVFHEAWRPADLGIAKTLASWTLRDLSPPAQPWVLVQRPPAPQNSYESVLLSTPLDQAPWRARLVLTPVGFGKVTLPVPESALKSVMSNLAWIEAGDQASKDLVDHPTLMVKWQWQLARHPNNKPLMQETGLLDVVLQKTDWAPAEVDPISQTAIKALLSSWIQKSEQALACEWMEAQVTRIQGQEINLNQGSLAGVKVGDQWLVADLPQVALHTLEPDSLSRTVLAEVRQVFPYSARLQVVAGQAKGVEPHWKAWPADALNDTVPLAAAPKNH